MGQMIRGLNIGGQRPTLFILDDPEDENNTKTPEAMDGNLRWLIQGAEPSLDAKKGKLVIIGTPIHERCIVWTLKETSKYRTMHYSCIMRDESGTEYSLWPEMFSLEELATMKQEAEELGKLSAFYKERLCLIIGDEDQPFKAEQIRYWKGTVEQKGGKHFLRVTHLGNTEKDIKPLEKEKIIPVNVFMGVDPASSLKKGADFTVIMVVGVDAEKNRYIISYYRRRATPMQVAESILSFYHQYKPLLTQIETTGYQEMLRDYIRSTGIAIPGLEIDNKPRNSKSERLQSFQPLFAQRKVYLQPDMKEFRDELIIYPRGRHEDTLDGFYYANKNAFPAHHTTDSFTGTGTKPKKSYLNWKLS
jgi:phage terminase large subunit-like protein